jgi:hypothetical protein
MCGAVVHYQDPIVTANCFAELPNLNQLEGLASGNYFTEGVTVNTFQVVGSNGQSESCVFEITVNDKEAPGISCDGLSTTLGNDVGKCSAVYEYVAPLATDNCPGPVTARTAGPQYEGEPYPVGSTTTTFEAADASGNTNSCSFTVVVEDREPPFLSCAGLQVTKENDAGMCGAVHDYQSPSCSDNCNICVTEQILGTMETEAKYFPVGTTTNSFVSEDTSGNKNSCEFAVVIVDTELPFVSCELGVNPSGKPAKKSTSGFFMLQASDNCGIDSIELIDAEGYNFGDYFEDGTLIKYDDDTDEKDIQDGSGKLIVVVSLRWSMFERVRVCVCVCCRSISPPLLILYEHSSTLLHVVPKPGVLDYKIEGQGDLTIQVTDIHGNVNTAVCSRGTGKNEKTKNGI